MTRKLSYLAVMAAFGLTALAQDSRVITTFVGGGATATVPAQSVDFDLKETRGLAVDPSGNLYILRKTDVLRVSRAGFVTRIAGGGTRASTALFVPANTNALTLNFIDLTAIAVDASGNIFLAENTNDININTKIFQVSGGIITYVAGGGANAADQPVGTAKISRANSMVVVPGSGLAITSGDGRVRLIGPTPNGDFVTTIAGILQTSGEGADGLPGTQAALNGPKTLALDGSFLLIGGTSCAIRRLNLATQIVDTLPGTAPGQDCAAVHSLAVRNGVVFVGRPFRVDQIAGGVITNMIGPAAGVGTGGDGGPPELAGLAGANLVAVDPGNDRIYVAADNRIAGSGDRVRVATTERVDLGISRNLAGGDFVPLIDNVPVAGQSARVIPGIAHTVEVPSFVVTGADTRLRFTNFTGVAGVVPSPGGAAPTRVTRVIGWAALTGTGAVYTPQNRLTVSNATPDGGHISQRIVGSSSPAGLIQTESSIFFDSAATVELAALPNQGFTFQNFTQGTTASSATPLSLAMTSPRAVTASFRAVGVFTPIRINSGGPAFVDAAGQTWAADTVGISTGEQIQGTADPALYQTARESVSTTLAIGSVLNIPITYEFEVPVRNYNLRLRFADFKSTAAGQRKFNILVNGAVVLSNFDIIAEAGGRSRALDKLFSVAPVNGKVTVTLAGGSAGKAMVNAVQLITDAVGVTVSPASQTLSATQSVAFVSTVAGSPDESVTWKLSPEVGSITAEGVYTAPVAIEKRQNITVTAISNADGAKSAQAVVRLSPPFALASVNGIAFAHQPLEGDGSIVAHVNLSSDSSTEAGVMIRASADADSPYVFAGLGPALAALSRSDTGRNAVSGSGIRWVKLTRLADQVTPHFSLDGVTWQAGTPFTVNLPFRALIGLALVGSEDHPAQSSLFDSVTIAGPGAIELSHRLGSVAAGASLQLDAALTGLADPNVTWSLSPNFGAITASGLYRAPDDAAAAPRRVTILATSQADQSLQARAVFQVGAFEPILINSGGEASDVFRSDTGFFGGQARRTEGEDLADVDRTARRSVGEPFHYRFALPNGEYRVRLRFIETDPAQALRRRFDIHFNDRPVLERFDIVAAAGGFRVPVIRQFTARVDNGELKISFLPTSGDAVVSSIEIVE